MTWSLAAALAFALTIAGCAVDGEPWAEADQGIWGVPRIANLRPSAGTIGAVDSAHLLDTAEGWGPQTLLLAISRRVQPQVSINTIPGTQVSKDKVTRTLQSAVGFSLTEEVQVTASSSTDVIEGWYERMEAYPTFQAITWDLILDGLAGATRVANGTVYRPVGVFFRTVVVVHGPGAQGLPTAPRPPGSITAIGSPVLGAEAVEHN